MDENTIKKILENAPPPVVAGPKEFSLERLLQHTHPTITEEEVEQFVAEIYAERRRAAGSERE